MSKRSATRLSRRELLSAVACVPAAVAFGGCLADGWDELPATGLTIATGNPGGVFDRYGDALASVLDDSLVALSVRTRSTNASVVNLRQVAAHHADLGFSLGDTASGRSCRPAHPPSTSDEETRARPHAPDTTRPLRHRRPDRRAGPRHP